MIIQIKQLLYLLFLLSSILQAQSYYLVSSAPQLSDEKNTFIPNTGGLKFSELSNERDNDNLDYIAASLKEIQDKIILHYNGSTITENVTIFIREGTYKEANITWKATSSKFTIKIINFNKEQVIFDGLDTSGNFKAAFLKLDHKGERTNFHLEGITIQNYINGIRLGEGIRSSLSENCIYNKETFNSHNSIVNNVFRRIGNKYCKSPSKKNIGYSAIGISNSNNNTIESNIFYEIENDQQTNPTGIHAIYATNYSKNNIILNNYVSYCSGSAFKMRNGCFNTIIESNYIEKTGSLSFIDTFFCASKEVSVKGVDPCFCPSAVEIPCDTIIMLNNICTFSYPLYDKETTLFYDKYLWADIEEAAPKNITDKNNRVIGGNNDEESIGDIVKGDINNDGLEETFIAYNYPSFSKLVRSNTKHPNYLSEVIDISSKWNINALTFNFFENEKKPSMITAYNSRVNDSTEIWKGTGISSSKDIKILHEEDGWEVTAITSGDYNNNGKPEIFIALSALDKKQPNTSKVYKGTGTTTIKKEDLVFTDSNLKIGALETIQDNILIAFNTNKGENKGTSQIYKGSGTGSNPLTNLDKLYSHPFWNINDLRAIPDDLNFGYRLFVSLNNFKKNKNKSFEHDLKNYSENLKITDIDNTLFYLNHYKN